ncbi:unnamed protein product, partial [Polarella glacialis]
VSMAEVEEEPQFDFGSKKKSKKKKEGKDEKGDDEVNEDCSGVGGKLVGNDWSVGPTYTYEEMLIRMYKIIEDKNPSLGTK